MTKTPAPSNDSKGQSSSRTQEPIEKPEGQRKLELFRVQFHEPVGNHQFVSAKESPEVTDDGVSFAVGDDLFEVPNSNIRYVHHRYVTE